tara:strand:+ start:20 stop:361 length:342 start_codon:yes stop_codon:yes gene_type:complete
MSNALENLPPEMQARLAQIMANAQQGQAPAAAEQPAAPQQPTPKPPSLMDHVIALRQEVNAMRQEVSAAAQVTEAVGNAVGQLYAMFQPSAGGTSEGPTYSQTFQQSVDDSDY